MIRRLAAILVCCWCASVYGQSTPSEPPAAPGVAAENAKTDDSSDRVFVQDAEGRWVAVPETQGATNGRPGDRTGAVAAYIAQLQLDGEVAGEFADMTARIRVELTRDDGWYELPLALDQAFIHDFEYTGDGKSAPVVQENATGGLRWLFEGAGTHRLTIKFKLPIKGTAAGRQLQLSLPQLPPNYITRAVLRIPDTHVLPAEAAPGVALQTRTLESGGTELECDVEGSRWELAWRTETNDAPRISKVVTSMRVRRDGGVLQLTARQQFTMDHSRLAEILVRRPSGFDLVSVELVGTPAESLTAVPEPGRAGWSRVRLGEELQGDFELDWQFQCNFPPPDNLVTIDGLDVDGARLQRGRIEIEATPGYAARYHAEESTAVYRNDVGDRRADEPLFDFSFDFQRQPCRLTYELLPVEAQTDADTEVFLSIGPNQSDLYLALDVEVISGQLHEIVIDWPGYAANGWRAGFARAEVEVDSGGAASNVVDATLDQDALAADPDQLRLQLSRPCAAGSLQTLLHFVRVTPVESKSLELALPHSAATSRRPHELTVASAVTLETTISMSGGEPPQIPRASRLPAELEQQFSGEDVRTYELPADPPPLEIRWTEQRKSISAETTLAIERLKSALKVSQSIDFDVAYGYVSKLDLEAGAVPAGGGAAPGTAGVTVRSDGQLLETELRDNLLRVKLKEPRRGRFSIVVEQVVAAPAVGAQRPVAVPILQSVDASYKSIVVRFPDAGPLRLADSETDWQAWLTRSADTGWRTTAARREVQLVADDTSQNLQQQFTIESAFVQTRFVNPGQTTVHAEYVLRDAPGRVKLTLPESASAAEFRWNGKDLSQSGGVHPAADTPERYVLVLSEELTGTQSGRLTVRYLAPRSTKPGLVSSYAVQFPQFGEKVVVDDSYWEIVLPTGEQLSSPPTGLVPRYAWERDTVMWARRLTPEYRALREKLVSNEEELAPRGNVYAYSTIRALPEGSFGAMAINVIVLIGAGFSLFLGFVFRRIPATRNLLSILVLGFLFALGGLWQLELMQLLLQPAALGLLLAAIATSFDVARRDRTAYQGRPLEGLPPIAERHSSSPALGSSIPARTAVYHPEISEPGRTA